MKVTLTGENSFGLHTELDTTIGRFLDEFGDVALERLDGEEVSYERIQEALQSLPFLARKKLVVLRTPSTNKLFLENAEHLLSDLPDSTDLIIIEQRLDKRLNYFKLLKRDTDFREFSVIDRNGLSTWLVNESSVRGGKLSLSDAQFLIDRLGSNQQILSGELEKLLLYDPKITRATISALTEPTPQSSIFDLLDAAFSGNTMRALELYEDQRAMKIEVPQIIAMLTWQLHILALIKTTGNQSIEQVAREAKLNPYVVRKSQSITGRLTLLRLKQLIADLLSIDARIKRENIDADEALLDYLFTIAVG